MQSDHCLDSENCVPARRAFSLALDQEASPEERNLVVLHLRSCLRCREFATRVAAVTGLLRSSSPVTLASATGHHGDRSSSQRTNQEGGIMRRYFILGVVGTVLVSTSIALAHNTRYAWTEGKAGKMVVRDATVRLPATERASLEGELKDAVRLYGALYLAAREVEDWNAASIYQSHLVRYQRALVLVQRGVDVAAAACKGSGAAMQGNRFKHFRCAVTSDALEVPTTALDYGDRELPLVIERAPRILGPFQATLSVHVTGKSSMTYR
jgi:hypothetical protein